MQHGGCALPHKKASELVLGEKFRTCHTERSGVVLDVRGDHSSTVSGPRVLLAGFKVEEKTLHPDVIVTQL